MANIFEGKLVGTAEQRYGVVVSRFNEFITSKLLGGCLDVLKRHGVSEENVDVAWVPGAFELPLAAQKMLANAEKDYCAVICLGAVIRGATPHFDLICNEVTKGIAQVMLASGKPVVNGVVTTNSIEQAIERAGTKVGNKGADAAATAIEMVNLLPQL